MGSTEQFDKPACLQIMGQNIDVGRGIRTYERQVGNIRVKDLPVKIATILLKPEAFTDVLWKKPVIRAPSGGQNDRITNNCLTVAQTNPFGSKRGNGGPLGSQMPGVNGFKKLRLG